MNFEIDFINNKCIWNNPLYQNEKKNCLVNIIYLIMGIKKLVIQIYLADIIGFILEKFHIIR